MSRNTILLLGLTSQTPAKGENRMRKDVMLAVAAVAIAVVGYLTWQSIEDDMTIKTEAPQVSAPAATPTATPPAAAPETAPPATPPAQSPQQ